LNHDRTELTYDEVLDRIDIHEGEEVEEVIGAVYADVKAMARPLPKKLGVYGYPSLHRHDLVWAEMTRYCYQLCILLFTNRRVISLCRKRAFQPPYGYTIVEKSFEYESIVDVVEEEPLVEIICRGERTIILHFIEFYEIDPTKPVFRKRRKTIHNSVFVDSLRKQIEMSSKT
jgi:hypothetical protein